MKAYTLTLSLLLLMLAGAVHAQRISSHAIGIRLSDGESFESLDLELSYQKRVFLTGRVEIDLGYRAPFGLDIAKGVALYEWVFQLNQNIHWYLGGGAGAEAVFFDPDSCQVSPLLAGVVGLEYDFNLPFSVSFDLRPEYYPDSSALDDLNFDLGVSLRYEF